MILHIDPVLLGRLLDNLVSNAIAAKHQRAVFEEFFQVGNSARNSDQGVGLGLSVAKWMPGSSPGMTNTFGKAHREISSAAC